MESHLEKFGIPKRNGPVGKSCASKFAEKRSLESRHLIFQILRLLTPRAFGRVWTDTLDRIPDALDSTLESVVDDRKVGR